MKNFNDRLIVARKNKKLTQTTLGKKLGVSQASIALWEKGDTKPNGNNLHELCKILDVNQDWLLHGGENLNSTSKTVGDPNAEIVGHFDTWDSKTPLNEDDVELPFFREVELSAGIGSEVVREDQGFKLRFSKSSLRNAGVDAANAACVQVRGNSMTPALPDASTVGIDTSKTKIIDGKMYAVDVFGMLYVKVLKRVPNGIQLVSINSDEYPPETYKGDELEHLRVIGQVFWSAAFHW